MSGWCRIKWTLIAAVVLAGPINFVIVSKATTCGHPNRVYGDYACLESKVRRIDIPGWYPDWLYDSLGFWLLMAASALALWIGYCELGLWRMARRSRQFRRAGGKPGSGF